LLVLELLFYSQGIWIPLSRCAEPYFSLVVVRNFKSFLRIITCRFNKKDEAQRFDETLLLEEEEGLKPMFLGLNSELNVELVYTILKGIQTQLNV
jgi:hypothetical protein